MLRVAHIDDLDFVNTDGLALTVYFQGCSLHCKGCQNKELQDFSGGTQYNNLDLLMLTLDKFEKGDYDYICLCGGEPLQQDNYYLKLYITTLTNIGIKVWLYTGYDYDNVPEWAKQVCYCIKAGAYDPINYPQKGGKLSSNNQCYFYKDGRREF